MDQNKIKTFWERPEGTTGMFIGIAILFALGYIGWTLLPIIITLMQNTIYAVILSAIAASLLYVVFFDNRLKTIGSYSYKCLMRYITGLIIEIDPIGILKNYIETLTKKLESLDSNIRNLSGQLRKVGTQIESNEQERINHIELANEAKKQNNKTQMILNARAAGRLDDSNKRLQILYVRIEKFLTILRKMYDACNIMIQDMENDVKVKSQERETIKSTYSAMTTVIKIIRGDQGRELYDQTMEYLSNDYGQKLGEIEHFMDISSNFIETIDLQNGIFDEKAFTMLEEWENSSSIQLPSLEMIPEQQK